MNIQAKLQKLREQQKQIAEALRTTEAEADTRYHKDLARAKFFLGDALLNLPLPEREALLPMLLETLTERRRNLVNATLAQSPGSSLDKSPDAASEA